jgi:23S rRNA (guanosine2251-2'-O)-methyltransferase
MKNRKDHSKHRGKNQARPAPRSGAKEPAREQPRVAQKQLEPKLSRSERQTRAPRMQHRAPLLFGSHAVREAWLNPVREIYALYVTEQSISGYDEILKEGRALKRPSPTILEKKQFDRMFPADTVHQGLAIEAKDLPEQGIRDIIIRGKNREKGLILILDQLTDPHNVGAIMRSACAFGCTGIIMQRKHAPALHGVLAKTASGAVEHMPVAYETNLSRSIEELKEAGYFVYGLDERGEQTTAEFAAKGIPQYAALVLGAEGPGIRHLVKEHCDALLKLPTSGPISSLNVSNAAAVSLYAFTAGK